MNENRGKVWLIGAGPGDPGLLTLAGRRALTQADMVVYDALANEALLAFARPDAKLVYVGKIAGQHALPQPEINALLTENALAGLRVARLKGGDPYIFGRGGEEAEYLVDHGIAFEEIPGISSAVAAPAYAGIPLTHRDFVSSLTIITGHEKPGKEDTAHDWEAFAKSGSTLVFVMGMKNIRSICDNLQTAGMRGTMPAAVIYRGATPRQRVVIATLADVATKAAEARLSNPAVIVIGKVVSLAGKLDWFRQKPLLGKTIVVTRALEQASDIAASLTRLGAIVIQCPTIKLRPLSDYTIADSAIDNLRDYAWIIFTSVNGVKFFWDRLAHSNRDSRALASCRVAAIGPATAVALEERGIRPDLVPPTYDADAVAAALIKQEGDKLANKKVLLPRALVAREALPVQLANAGAIVDIAPVYENVPADDSIGEVRAIMEKGELDCITFGSSSTVDNFFRLVPPEEIKKHPQTALAAIGPITAASLHNHGLQATIQPHSYTIPALIDAIVAYYQRQQS